MSKKKVKPTAADRDRERAELKELIDLLAPVVERTSKSEFRTVQGLGAVVAGACSAGIAGESAVRMMVLLIQPVMKILADRVERYKASEKKGGEK